MAKKKSPSPPNHSVPFETALERLKSVVHELEDGNLSLTDSLDKYESGVNSLKHCYTALKTAEKRIELLVQLDDSGNLITEPFDDAATEQTTRKTTRSSKVSKPSKTAKPKSGAKSEPKSSPKDSPLVDDNDDESDWDDEDMDEPDGLF